MAKQITLVILFVALALAANDSSEDTAKNSTTVSTPVSNPVCSVGLCCFNNEFKSKNVLCGYSTSECLADSYCTGDSAECPPLTKKPDGTACARGVCVDGICVSKVCFGECCDKTKMTTVADGKPCGYNEKGKCVAGVCQINEEFTAAYLEKERAKEESYKQLVEKLMKNNELKATKKAARWFNTVKKSQNTNKNVFQTLPTLQDLKL